MKRRYPLFIIDSSREHGRGTETDYISCTSSELPFIASATLHEEKEYAEQYNPSDVTTQWSDPRNRIRMRVRVISSLPSEYDRNDLKSLLRRALKEMLIRKTTQVVDIDNVKDADIAKWAQTIKQQVVENIRNGEEVKYQKMHLAILSKIIERFNDK